MTADSLPYLVADLSLAGFGRKEIQLAEHEMPGLMAVREEYAPSQPLRGARVTGSLHVQTAVLNENLLGLAFMRITEAARRLGTSARMLRYREELGLLPQVRDRLGMARRPAGRGSAVRTGSAGGTIGRAGGSGGAGGAGGAGGLAGAAHRQFSEADLEAVAAALALERRYDISPGISCSASWISLRPKEASERSATRYGS